MSLDPQAQKLLDMARDSGLPPVYKIPVLEARERMRKAFIAPDEPELVSKVETKYVPVPDFKIPLRIYTPVGDGPFPALIFFHGGGWVLNDLDTHDAVCRSLANQVGCVVVSVDYRRSPEYKFPFPIYDSLSAFNWTVWNARDLNIDEQRIAVGGDSSGGTQATVVAMLARDQHGPEICFQWLACPATDHFSAGYSSYTEMATGYSLNREFMVWFWGNYLPEGINLDNPYLCPLRAENLSHMPPAFIMTAHYDPLRDEAELYGKRLMEAGGKVLVKRYEDQMHGFIMQRRNIDKAQDAFNDVVENLKRAFAIN